MIFDMNEAYRRGAGASVRWRTCSGLGCLCSRSHRHGRHPPVSLRRL